MIFPPVCVSFFFLRTRRAGAVVTLSFALAPSLMAAPLDGLLTAYPEQFSSNGHVEVAYDAMNETLDVLNIRDDDPRLSGTNIGDYQGYHLRAGWSLMPSLWMDAGLWQRKIDYRDDQVAIDSWQVAGQYRVMESSGLLPALALRLSAWGNHSDEIAKSTPTAVAGVTLDSITIHSPEDQQIQLDLIGSWKTAKGHEFTLLGSVGSSRVSVGSITATDTQGGCLYDLVFGQTELTGTLASPCSADVVVNSFTIPYDTLGINVPRETEYDARFVQLGLIYSWIGDQFMLRSGYTYQSFQRDYIDDTISARGGTAYETNHALTVELSMRIARRASMFVRGSAMSNQLMGEIPFAYNTVTARSYNNKYGIVSAGLMVGF